MSLMEICTGICTYTMQAHVYMMSLFVTICFPLLLFCRPAGQGIVELFQSNPVQEFFNGMTSLNLHLDAIYKPGILTMVCNKQFTGACDHVLTCTSIYRSYMLGCETVSLCLEMIRSQYSCRNCILSTFLLDLPPSLSLSDEESVYGIVSCQISSFATETSFESPRMTLK